MPHNDSMVPVGPTDIIGPDRFGPSLWQGLHYITLGYPVYPTEEQKEKYKTFFSLLKYTLPCSVCANHYAENLKKMPITDEVLKTRESLVKWLIDFHNIVNKMKGKPVIEYEKARKMIDTDLICQPINNNNNNNNNNDIIYIYTLIGILVTMVLIAVVYKKK
jgi:hypothetical protein